MKRRLLVALLPPGVAVACIFVFGALLIALVGQDPLVVGGEALESTLLTGYGISQLLFKATPLIFTGLAVAIPLSAGLINIGGEGQLLLGAIFSAAVASTLFPGLGPLVTPVAMLGGVVAGGAGGAVAGWLKHARGVHEVISTIMLNFVFAALCSWLLNVHLEEPGTSHTPELPPEALFVRLSTFIDAFAGSLVSTSLFYAIIVAALAQLLVFRTTFGFELRASGMGPLAARHAGVPSGRMLVVSMAIGGAMAGLAGGHYVLGARRFFEEGIGAGDGFLGIAVALMAHGSPWTVIPASLLFALLSQAGLSMGAYVPREMVLVLQGLVVLALGATSAIVARLPIARLDDRPVEEASRA